MKKGKAYGVGVGPGDPELMTLKAVRLIRENHVFAVPGSDPKASLAYRIAAGAVPELEEKELFAVNMPMLKDRTAISAAHREAASMIERYLEQGENVVYLTLGDPTIYCTFSYIQHILENDGFELELISGVPSFCAAAARLNIPLAEWNEPIHIIPAIHSTDEELTLPGTYVLMKSARGIGRIREKLLESGRKAAMVENCGLPNERIYKSVEDITDDAGYFSLIISKN